MRNGCTILSLLQVLAAKLIFNFSQNIEQVPHGRFDRFRFMLLLLLLLLNGRCCGRLMYGARAGARNGDRNGRFPIIVDSESKVLPQRLVAICIVHELTERNPTEAGKR
uniref:Putative secreted protein n=1 Tax=Anopheles darlingi TaxID=43151 RepID=A0A2M4DKT4_ANODA